MTQVFRQVVVSVERSHARPDGTLRRRVHYPVYVARVLLQVLRQWARDRCPQQAASLAFQTALSLVPLIAIGLALLRATGAFAAESTLVVFLSRQVLPVSRDEIARHLIGWAGNLSFEKAGVLGLASTLIISFFLYSSVEQIFNDIWRVERRRSLGQRFVVFYALVTIVPLLLGISLYHAARYGLTRGVPGFLASLGATWGALFFANKLLPATRVRWAPAAVGALLSAVAFELAKVAFHLYVARVAFQKYAGVYGTLVLVPLALLWIYYSWLVILFGTEVAHSIQNLHNLEGRERRGRPGDDSPLAQVSGAWAARLMIAVVGHWRRGEPPPSADVLGAELGLHQEVVTRLLSRLAELHVVIQTGGDEGGYVPARPPADITLHEILSAFRTADALGPPPGDGSRLDEVISAIETGVRDKARAITLEEL